MRKLRTVLLVLLVLTLPAMAAGNAEGVFNVKDYGAKADGKTLDNDFINKAIIACNKAGGGTVYFPAGTYLSGSIRLKSNVALYLDMGAKILGAANDIDAYDHYLPNPYDMYQDFGHSHWRNSLIWGENLENIAILGHGMIHGGGMTKGQPVPQGGGNKAIALKLCRNILIKDITIAHGGHFAILPTGCDNMVIDNVKIDTNRDGINIDSCKNVRISNCIVNSPTDDAYVPKSSYALGYLKPTENLTITNCIGTGYKEGTFLDGTFVPNDRRRCGRFKLGTESNGGFKNITVSNCVFEHSEGISLLEVDGGTLENITINNITMKNTRLSPIFMRLGNRARGPNNPPVGKMRNIKISNIVADDIDPTYGRGFYGAVISGIPGHMIENVTLSNIRLNYKGGAPKEFASIQPPENETKYPSEGMFRSIPAYGFYCRHVKGLEFHDVKVSFDNEDLRPVLIFEDIDGLVLDNFKADRAAENDVPIVLKNIKDLEVYNSIDFPLISVEYKKAKLSKDTVITDEPFSVTVAVQSDKSGIATVKLFDNSKLFATEYIWLDAGEKKDVTFSDIKVEIAGKHKIEVGGSKFKLHLKVKDRKLSQGHNVNNRSIFKPVKVTAQSPRQITQTITAETKVFTDRDYVFGPSLSNEFAGLTTVQFSCSEAKRGNYPVKFSVAESAKVFVGFFTDGHPSHAQPSSDWTLHKSGYKFAKSEIDIYYRNFPAGSSEIKFPKGSFLIIGFVKSTL